MIEKAHQGAAEMLRPISRKYDLREHDYPVELDTLATLFEGISEAKTICVRGRRGVPRRREAQGANHNGGNMSAVLNVMEISWGDVALMLSVPLPGPRQRRDLRRGHRRTAGAAGQGVWAAMAITEPGFGSDSAAVSTTAKLDGDEYVINGEKIFVTAGSRATHIVVWATLDKSLGRAAIKSFIVPREHPGVTVERLEDKLGIKASDTAVHPVRQRPHPEGQPAGQTRRSTWRRVLPGSWRPSTTPGPIVAAMAVGIARAALEELRKILDRRRRGDLLRQARARPERRRPRSSCGWRPTGRPATC